MRRIIITGIVASLALIGCSTTTEPSETTPVDTSVQNAVELAAEACAGLRTVAVEGTDEERLATYREGARLTAEAAYLDSRWRTLADALTTNAQNQSFLMNRQLYPDSYVPDFTADETVLAECTLAEALLEEVESEDQ